MNTKQLMQIFYPARYFGAYHIGKQRMLKQACTLKVGA